MKKQFAVPLALVALASAVLGFLVAQYTSATRSTQAAPAVSAAPAVVRTASPMEGPTVVLPDFADIAERANPAVVRVSSTETAGVAERRGHGGMPDNPFHWFFGPGPGGPGGPGGPQFQQRSQGTGFVISEDGYVFTNHHVVENATKIEVTLSDDSKYTAKKVGEDAETDIALLKIDPAGKRLPVLPLGDSEKVRVGEWVCAIGNPFMYEHSVTVGVISAKGRRLDPGSSFESFLQTDAAINFGNSGGPLLNVKGEVIGINTAISSQGQNIGFAVPVNLAKEILPQLKDKGRVVRGYLGVHIQPIEPDLAKSMRLQSREGALVSDVEAGEAGDKAGLKAGDVIVEVAGQKIESPDRLVHAISTHAPGEAVPITVVRDGAPKQLRATLGERKTDAQVAAKGGGEEETGGGRLGVSVADLTPRVRAQYRVEDDAEGIVVTDVDANGPAADGSLREGDVIAEVNRKPVKSVADLRRLLKDVKAGEDVLLYVVRRGVKFWQPIQAGGGR